MDIHASQQPIALPSRLSPASMPVVVWLWNDLALIRDAWRLPDGTSASLRPADADDAGAIRAFVAGLSEESRYQRFFYPVRELLPELARRFTRAESMDAMTLLAFAHVGADERLIGMAQYISAPHPQVAEFAVAIADDWQGQGVGRRLMQALIQTAHGAGFERMEADMLAANNGMRRLMHGLGFDFKRHADGPYLTRLSKVLQQGLT